MTSFDVSPTAFRRQLTRSVVAPPALLAVLAMVFLGQILYLLSAARWVDHTDRVIAGANNLLAMVVDGETGMRGYLVTGDPLFLEPYHAEEQHTGPTFDELEAMVADSPAQVGRLRTLREAHADWRAYAGEMIRLRREGGDHAGAVRNSEGKRRMDAIRRQIADFILVERRLRDARTQAVLRATWTVIGTCLCLSLALGAGLAHLTRRHLTVATSSYREALDRASRLAAIVESSEDAIIGATPGRTIASWNPGATHLYGYEREEVLGKPVAILIPPERSDELPAIFGRIHRGDRVEPFETQQLARDGRRIDVSVGVFPLRGPDGTIVGTAAIARDITAKRRANEDLNRLARRLEALHEIDRAILGAESLERLVAAALERLVQAVPCGGAALALLDEEQGRATVVATEDGRGPGPIQSMPVTALPAVAALREAGTPEITATEAQARMAPEWRRVLGDGAHGLIAFPLREDGRLRGVLYLLACEPEAMSEDQQAIGKEVANQFAIAVQQVRLREELRRHADELEQRVEERTAQLQATNAALEAFSDTISHDLRAPLRAMEGIAQALVEDFGDRLGPIGLDYAGRVVASARKLDGLIQDLLDYSRLNRADLQPQAVDLEAAVREAQEPLKDVIRGRDAEVSTRSPMPPVLAHRPMLVQVIRNLVDNSLKFVAPGVRPRIRLWAEPRQGWVRLWVEDNGLGIAPRQHDRIFGVFERLHGDETYPGTGIGLAIVKKAVERMGGRVGLESAEGRGSRFWIELAAVQEPITDIAPPADDGGSAR